MKKITDDAVNAVHVEMWAAASKKHGGTLKVPRDEVTRIGEFTRGLYVLQSWQNTPSAGNPIRFLRSYGVMENIVTELVEQYLGKEHLAEAAKDAKPEKRADKWRALEDWAKQNTFAEVPTDKVVEVAGFSYQTVLNYLKTSPYFRKIQKGLWEVRDPKEDRAREKNG